MGAVDDEIQRNIQNAKRKAAADREAQAQAERVLRDPNLDTDALVEEVSEKLFAMPLSTLVDTVPDVVRHKWFLLLDEAAEEALRDRAALARILF